MSNSQGKALKTEKAAKKKFNILKISKIRLDILNPVE